MSEFNFNFFSKTGEIYKGEQRSHSSKNGAQNYDHVLNLHQKMAPKIITCSRLSPTNQLSMVYNLKNNIIAGNLLLALFLQTKLTNLTCTFMRNQKQDIRNSRTSKLKVIHQKNLSKYKARRILTLELMDQVSVRGYMSTHNIRFLYLE